MTAPADQPRPAELLDALHDGPDLTGPLVDFETHNAPADPLLETIAKALHEWDCPLPLSCQGHTLPAAHVLAALLSDAGSTQWGVRWEGRAILFEGTEAEVREFVILGGQTVVRRQVLELHGDWEDAT